MPRVYLDHASAAPWHPAALAATLRAAEDLPGDPARAHAEGRAARDLLEAARGAVAQALGAGTDRVLFTSGGTEAVHLAVRGVAAAAMAAPQPAVGTAAHPADGAADAAGGASRGRDPRSLRIVSSAVEHTAVHAAAEATGCEHVRVPVDRAGRVDLDALAAALRGGALLVNLQHANHEVGTLQPVAEAAALCRDAGALLHVDACQTAGRLPVDLAALGADLVSVSGAKFGAGRGIGALAWSPRARFRPLLTGDERERRRRSGLEHLPGIAALAETLLALAPVAAAEAARCDALRRRLRGLLRAVPDVEVHGPEDGSAPHIVAASALYVEGQALLSELDRAGYAVHSGSSCATTSGEPSHVLVAMGALTHGHVRASLGPRVGAAEVDGFAQALGEAVGRLRARAGVGAG